MKKARIRYPRPTKPPDFTTRLWQHLADVRKRFFPAFAILIALSAMLSDEQFRRGFESAFRRIAEVGPLLFGLSVAVM